MAKPTVVRAWNDTCALRKEIRDRSLSQSDFAIDLSRVAGITAAGSAYYCDPRRFFSTTYATNNLRRFCKVVLRRLAGETGGEPIVNVAQTFGGGKSHTLAALYYLTTLGLALPKNETSVEMILNDAQLTESPQAVAAVISFDKVDWVTGGEFRSPDGQIRRFRMPWNMIAWQLLGQTGLDVLQRDESKPDSDTPPSDVLWTKILDEVESHGKGALILIDEFLMWAHDAASPDPSGERKDKGPVWYDRLKNFFQRLSGAIDASQRSCLVVSLLATEPNKKDDVGNAILTACNSGLNRQASTQSPVEREDLAELLRRRLFEKYPQDPPDRHKYVLAFWERMKIVDPVRSKQPDADKRIVDAYPFHPDLLDRFFGKWTGLNQFQRTRGVLQTFALALRDAEKWDESPLISSQVFLSKPGEGGLSEALQKMAEIAKDSESSNPQWPNNLKIELPRALIAQNSDAATLTGREVEAACVACFIFSQPIGEQAELADLRWLLGATCEMPAVLNSGLSSWARMSWYLEECAATEAATGVPKYWRLGPKPNLNQLHHSYKQNAQRTARAKFDELAGKCTALYDGLTEEDISPHKLPDMPAEIGDDGQFRIVVLGAEYAGTVGNPPETRATDFIRTHTSPTVKRIYQNCVLVVTPSLTGLQQAEQYIAEWMAWTQIRTSPEFKQFGVDQQEIAKRSEKASLAQAQGAVKNAYELVVYLENDGSVQSRKITMGSESLLNTLVQKKALRLFRQKIDPQAIMPGGLYSVWLAGTPSVRVSDLYKSFAQQPHLPKLLSQRTVVNTIGDAVLRGVLALRCTRPDGSEQWFWHCGIDMAEWYKTGDAWLPQCATLGQLNPTAVLPSSLKGLWTTTDAGVALSTVCSWFDGKHSFEEETQPGYPPEKRPMPAVDFKVVHRAVGKAVLDGSMWLVYGNDSVFRETPTALQLDPAALLHLPPLPLAAIDLLPASLPGAWSPEAEPRTTPNKLYAENKAKTGRPLPERVFLDSLNTALAQGYLHVASGSGSVKNLKHDGNTELRIRSEAPKPEAQPVPMTSGRKTTATVSLTAGEVQTLGEEISELTKALAGMEPTVDVRVTIKSLPSANLLKAAEVLARIKKGWGFV